MRRTQKNEDDTVRVRQFQDWVRKKREEKNFTYQQVADNYNKARPTGDPELTRNWIRRLEDREYEGETIQRGTCRRVAMGLHLDVNEVLIQAGYLPDDQYLDIDELPIETRIEYSRLSDESKKRIQRFIKFEYQENQERDHNASL